MMPFHEERHDIGLRSMTQADIPLGLRLASIAGWNQTETDWQMLLAAGFGLVATCGTRAVGTATVMPYDAVFSWIGMVLVDPAYRRRGVGTALLKRAIAEAKPYGFVRLDATPQGEPLYARLGFGAEYGLVRMVRRDRCEPSIAAGFGTPGEAGCRALGPERLHDLVAFDGPIFGAERGSVLGALIRDAPRYAYVSLKDGALCGYCLGRSGAVHEQIGPVVADTLEVAQALLICALSACGDRSVIVDVVSAQASWVAFLYGLGFEAQRPFMRMALGCDGVPGIPERTYAIGGPEIG